MDLMEYKAKELFDKYEIPTKKGIVVDDATDLASRATGMTFPLVVKAQVQIGGRGKAGGIKFANNVEELLETSKSILGMDIKGHIVKKLLIVEKADIGKELYISILLDRLTKGPVIIFSSQGGVDIEEIARTTPEKVLKVSIDPLIGIHDYVIRYLLGRSGLSDSLFDQMFGLVRKLYKLFREYDCMLTEINPLVITQENKLLALDGKVSVDDNALSRQSDILAFRDSLPEDALILEARKFNFLYIPCEPEGNIAVMSNGSGMIMSCIDLISKQGMQVGAALDLGGGATSERIAEAVRIILTNKNIKALFISIFGGITRCDEVAGGVKLAMEKQAEEKILVIRVEGTNKEKGLEIINSIKGQIISVDGIREGVKVLADRRGQI
jgi:succinyl-CoA synthetase, beta subunit